MYILSVSQTWVWLEQVDGCEGVEGEESCIGGQGSKVPEVGAATEGGEVGDSMTVTVEGKHGEEGQSKEGVERSPTVWQGGEWVHCCFWYSSITFLLLIYFR